MSDRARALPRPVSLTRCKSDASPRVLVVTAHPDDEILFAGLLYKLRTHLHGAADLVVVTNGEGGFKYSTLAEPLYGYELTDESVGRARLPAIRAAELAAGCRLLGVRDMFLLGETDHRYTQDVLEVLGPEADVWDLKRVRAALRELLQAREYDFVLLMAPTEETHGHHQAVTLLALEVLAEMPAASRPVPLCARTASAEEPNPLPPPYRPAFPLTALRSNAPALVFDRTQKFGYRGRLDYGIVVNWAIAEHRSQGTMQALMGRGLAEHYFLFELAPAGAKARALELFEALAEPQYPERSYSSSAGTQAARRP